MTEKKRIIYKTEFKKEAVGLVSSQGYTAAEAARDLGIQVGILNRWSREQLKEPQNAFSGIGHRTPKVEELEHLRKENCRLKMEKGDTKKAAAFFAKEPE